MTDNKSLSYLMDIDKNNKAGFSEIKSKIDSIVSDIDVKVDELSDVVDSFPSGILPPSLISLTSESTDDGIKLKYKAYATYNPQDNLGIESDNLDRNISVLTKGIMFRYSETNYPMNRDEGTLIFKDEDLFDIDANGSRVSKEKEYTVVGLTKDKTYYISAFPYSTYGIYNESSGINLGSSYSNRTKMTWVGNKGTISVNVILPEGYSGTLGEYTITLVDQDTSSPQNIEKTATSAGVTQFSGLTGGKSYKVRLSDTDDFRQVSDSDIVTVVGGQNHNVNMNYTHKYGSVKINISSDYNVNPVNNITVTLTQNDGDKVVSKSIDGVGSILFTRVDIGTYNVNVSKIDLYNKPDNKQITVLGGVTSEENIVLSSSTNMEEYTISQIVNMFRAGKGNIFPIGSSKKSNVYKLSISNSEVSSSPEQISFILCEVLNSGTRGRFVTSKWVSSDTASYRSGSPIGSKYSSIIESLRSSMFPEWSPYMKTSTTNFSERVPATTYNYKETQNVHYFSTSQLQGSISYFNSNSRRKMDTEGAYFLLDSWRDDNLWYTYIVDSSGSIDNSLSGSAGLVVNFVIG